MFIIDIIVLSTFVMVMFDINHVGKWGFTSNAKSWIVLEFADVANVFSQATRRVEMSRQ